MSEHTPGPWTVEPKSKWSIETNARAVIDKDRFPVAWSPAWDVAEVDAPASPIEAEANARLIAAAPDLIEPWENVDAQDWEYLLSLIPDGGRGRFWKEVFTKQRAAIAKATLS